MPLYVPSSVADGSITSTKLSTSLLDTDSALAANSDTRIASQKATKSYADAVASGLSVKGSVRLATAAALPTNARVGNVLTGAGFGALSVDGSVVVAGDRILVKDEATGANNGIYDVTVVGTGATAFVLTRSSDADTSAEVKEGTFVFVAEGSVNIGSGWVLTTPAPITLNTTALTFTQFSGTGEITAGSGITKSGNTLSANFGTTSGTVAQGDNTEYAYSSYRGVERATTQVPGGQAVGTYATSLTQAGVLVQGATSISAMGTFYFDPADYAAGSRTVKLRLACSLVTNATAPASTFAMGIYPVTAAGGAASATCGVTFGTVTSGSTVTFTTPVASTLFQGNSGDFTAPVAGYYGIGLVVSVGTTAANSTEEIHSVLQVRQV